MSNLGGDCHSFALHIKHDRTLICTFNSVNQNTLPTESTGNTVQHENISLKKIELNKFYNIKDKHDMAPPSINS